MKNIFNLLKCEKCGAIVQALKNCECENCGIMCCNEKMTKVEAKLADKNAGKHEMFCERVEDELYVTMKHPMEKEHYVEWIACVKDETVHIHKLYPEGDCSCRFKYKMGATVYAYCNLHGLWQIEV